MIETKGRKGTFVMEMARATKHQQTIGLDAAAESLVVVARQLGADEPAVLDAVRRVWRNL